MATLALALLEVGPTECLGWGRRKDLILAARVGAWSRPTRRLSFLWPQPEIKDGRLLLPTGPGWGTDVNEEAVRAHPPRKRS